MRMPLQAEKPQAGANEKLDLLLLGGAQQSVDKPGGASVRSVSK